MNKEGGKGRNEKAWDKIYLVKKMLQQRTHHTGTSSRMNESALSGAPPEFVKLHSGPGSGDKLGLYLVIDPVIF